MACAEVIEYIFQSTHVIIHVAIVQTGAEVFGELQNVALEENGEDDILPNTFILLKTL